MEQDPNCSINITFHKSIAELNIIFTPHCENEDYMAFVFLICNHYANMACAITVFRLIIN